MPFLQTIKKLTSETQAPCVTISLNTHRTHPDSLQDKVVLKNLLAEAEERVVSGFGKRPVAPLLEKMASVPDEVDVNYNLDSLHIFLSNDTKEIVRSVWPVLENGVHISDTFAVRPLIKAYNRSEEYMILLLSQGGVSLFEALNDSITGEVRNSDFPFKETPYYITHGDKGSDPKLIDNMIREYFNQVDKALVKVQKENQLPCVVICTEGNYSFLLQVADNPGGYVGYAPVDYNNVAIHQIANQAWSVMRGAQKQRVTAAIHEVREAAGPGRVLTDLQDIYQASIDGRGDLLLMDQTFSQAVKMTGDRTFELAGDGTQPDDMDDISSMLAWEVMSKNGRVFFVEQNQLGDLGVIALKTRY